MTCCVTEVIGFLVWGKKCLKLQSIEKEPCLEHFEVDGWWGCQISLGRLGSLIKTGNKWGASGMERGDSELDLTNHDVRYLWNTFVEMPNKQLK